jgi:hypothetical protein
MLMQGTCNSVTPRHVASQPVTRNPAQSREFRDHGERGAGRLRLVVKPRAGRVTAEWYAVYYLGGKRAKAKPGSHATMTVAEPRRIFLTEYARDLAGAQSRFLSLYPRNS